MNLRRLILGTAVALAMTSMVAGCSKSGGSDTTAEAVEAEQTQSVKGLLLFGKDQEKVPEEFQVEDLMKLSVEELTELYGEPDTTQISTPNYMVMDEKDEERYQFFLLNEEDESPYGRIVDVSGTADLISPVPVKILEAESLDELHTWFLENGFEDDPFDKGWEYEGECRVARREDSMRIHIRAGEDKPVEGYSIFYVSELPAATVKLDTIDPGEMIGLTKDELFKTYGDTFGYEENEEYFYNCDNVLILAHTEDGIVKYVDLQYREPNGEEVQPDGILVPEELEDGRESKMQEYKNRRYVFTDRGVLDVIKYTEPDETVAVAENESESASEAGSGAEGGSTAPAVSSSVSDGTYEVILKELAGTEGGVLAKGNIRRPFCVTVEEIGNSTSVGALDLSAIGYGVVTPTGTAFSHGENAEFMTLNCTMSDGTPVDFSATLTSDGWWFEDPYSGEPYYAEGKSVSLFFPDGVKISDWSSSSEVIRNSIEEVDPSCFRNGGRFTVSSGVVTKAEIWYHP